MSFWKRTLNAVGTDKDGPNMPSEGRTSPVRPQEATDVLPASPKPVSPPPTSFTTTASPVPGGTRPHPLLSPKRTPTFSPSPKPSATIFNPNDVSQNSYQNASLSPPLHSAKETLAHPELNDDVSEQQVTKESKNQQGTNVEDRDSLSPPLTPDIEDDWEDDALGDLSDAIQKENLTAGDAATSTDDADATSAENKKDSYKMTSTTDKIAVESASTAEQSPDNATLVNRDDQVVNQTSADPEDSSSSSLDEIANYDIVPTSEETSLTSGWARLVDSSSGDFYYFNEAKNITSWDPPTTEQEAGAEEHTPTTIGQGYGPLPSGWVELIDPSSGDPYYLNEAENITSWDRPTDQSRTEVDTSDREEEAGPTPTDPKLEVDDDSDGWDWDDSDKANNFEGEEEHAAEKAFNEIDERSPIQAAEENTLPSGWEELVDPDSGDTYYFHEEENLTTWDKPTLKPPATSVEESEDSQQLQGEDECSKDATESSAADDHAEDLLLVEDVKQSFDRVANAATVDNQVASKEVIEDEGEDDGWSDFDEDPEENLSAASSEIKTEKQDETVTDAKAMEVESPEGSQEWVNMTSPSNAEESGADESLTPPTFSPVPVETKDKGGDKETPADEIISEAEIADDGSWNDVFESKNAAHSVEVPVMSVSGGPAEGDSDTKELETEMLSETNDEASVTVIPTSEIDDNIVDSEDSDSDDEIFLEAREHDEYDNATPTKEESASAESGIVETAEKQSDNDEQAEEVPLYSSESPELQTGVVVDDDEGNYDKSELGSAENETIPEEQYQESLPNGWIQMTDPGSGRPYFVNEAEGVTTWVRPMSITDDDPSLPRLPPGWRRLLDPSSGLPYYLNETDNSTTWEMPLIEKTSASSGLEIPDPSGVAPDGSEEANLHHKGEEMSLAGKDKKEQQADDDDGWSDFDELEEKVSGKAEREAEEVLTTKEEEEEGNEYSHDSSKEGNRGYSPADVDSTVVEVDSTGHVPSSQRIPAMDIDQIEEDAASRTLQLVATPDSFYSPRFEFLSSVPTELQKLQEQSAKRREDFHSQIHDMECKLASATARLAEETMDRDAVAKDWMDRSVYHPLEQVSDRVFATMEKELSPSYASAGEACLADLDRRMIKLHTNLTRHIHMVLFDRKSVSLDSFHPVIEHDLAPSLRIDSAKATKQEGAIVKKFESIVGTMARKYQETLAERKSSLELMQEKLAAAVDSNAEEKGEQFFADVQKLRRDLQQEKAERKKQDQEICEKIAQTAAAMKRALLEAVGDPSS